MASKKEILSKIRILITQSFENPEEAFHFFDKNSDGYLTAKELKKLVKSAKVSSLISGVVASKMIQGLDKDKDKKFDWNEFKKAVDDLIKQGLKSEKAKS